MPFDPIKKEPREGSIRFLYPKILAIWGRHTPTNTTEASKTIAVFSSFVTFKKNVLFFLSKGLSERTAGLDGSILEDSYLYR